MIRIVALIYLLFVAVGSQFIHEFHIKENTMMYKSILNLKRLLISKNKIDTSKSRDSKIYMSTVINSGLFTLDADSNLKVAKHIDREELCPTQVLEQSRSLCGSVKICCHFLEFQVSYKDEDVQSYFLRVFVDDENDNRPIFPIIPSPFTVVEENRPVGQKIFLPKAQDADSDSFGVSRYKLQVPFLLGNSSDFELDQDSKNSAPFLIITSQLDREKTPKYTFNLIAIDGQEDNRNTGQTEITIKIRDVNDNIPRFEKHVYSTTVKEHSVPDPLFEVTVTDEDEDDNGRIELSIVDTGVTWPSRFFSIDVTDNSVGKVRAKVRTTVTLDFEKLPHLYEFKILAKDRGRNPLTSFATVRIQVININDMSPEIRFVRNGRLLTTGFSIVEGTASNVMLAHVQVSDLDSPTSQLQCTLRSSELRLVLEESRFRHPANIYKQYNLRTMQPIDREAINDGLNDSRMLVTVQCFDHDIERPLTSSTSIFIVINDINDNPPKFSQSRYNGYIEENVVNQPIIILPPIRATDKDKSFNSKLSFYLQDDQNKTDSQFFRVDQETAKIFNVQPFDFEKKTNYDFIIIAHDHGLPIRLSASAHVTVRVSDRNDNAPKFEKSHFTFSIEENVPIGYLIGTISATDKDTLSKNTDVRYYVKSDLQNRAENYVSLDSITGQIRTRQPIDRETLSTITFIGEARNPSKVEVDSLQEAMVIVNILDVNDCAPTFRLVDPMKSRMIIYLESLEQGQVCEPIPFVVEDADDASKSAMCCDVRLKNDYNGMLSISTESQTIICVNRVPLDMLSIHVALIANDRNGNRSLEGEASFTILLKNDPNSVAKTKIKTPNNKEQQPLHRKEDLRQITLVTILASLAGICLLIIIVIITISQKRCDRFSVDNDLIDDEKNNDNNSQPMIDRQCIVHKNDLEGSPFGDMLSTSHGHYYNMVHGLQPPASCQQSIPLSKYKKSPDPYVNEEYGRTLQLAHNYQHLQRRDESYQMLSGRMANYDQFHEHIPSKTISKSDLDSSILGVGESDIVRLPPIVPLPVTKSQSHCSQTSFV